jgi:hypothetical protein
MPSNPYPRVAHPRAFRYDLTYRPASYSAPVTPSTPMSDSDPAATLLAEVAGFAIATIRFGRPGTTGGLGGIGGLGGTGGLGGIGGIGSHVVEIRATPRGNHVTYAIVDDFGSSYRPFHPVSSEPLNLGSVAELIEESVRVSDAAVQAGRGSDGGQRGVLLPVLETVFGFASGRDARRETAASRSALVDAVRAFVRVESGLYPGLDRYFEERIDEWLASKGCLSAPRYRAGAVGRFPDSGPKLEPASPRVPFSCVVAGPEAAGIDRVVRAWWRSREAPVGLEGVLDLGRDAARLRSALRREVSRTGRLPRGRFEVGSGLERLPVDMEDLTDDGC